MPTKLDFVPLLWLVDPLDYHGIRERHLDTEEAIENIAEDVARQEGKRIRDRPTSDIRNRAATSGPQDVTKRLSEEIQPVEK